MACLNHPCYHLNEKGSKEEKVVLGEDMNLEPITSIGKSSQFQGCGNSTEAAADDDDVSALARFHVTQIGQTQAPSFSVSLKFSP